MDVTSGLDRTGLDLKRDGRKDGCPRCMNTKQASSSLLLAPQMGEALN